MNFSNETKAQVFRTAWTLFKNGVATFGEALRTAWAKVKANAAKTVTFVKVSTGETTTRNIAPITFYKAKGTSKPTPKKLSTIKVLDLDKVAAGLPSFKCIISFHHFQIIKFTY